MFTSVFGFIDESGNPNPSVPEGNPDEIFFLLGLSLSTIDNSEEIVNAALEDLSKRSISSPSDREALNRGYFHASLDGPEAHSCLCTAIRSICPPTTFEVLAFDKRELRGKRHELLNERQLHQHMVKLVAAPVSNLRKVRLDLTIAERQPSFVLSDASTFESDFYNALAHSSALNPMLPCYFPPIKISIGSGNDYGVQIVDFVLWAIKRHLVDKNDVWLERLGRWNNSSFKVTDDPLSGYEIQVNGGIQDDEFHSASGSSPYGSNLDLETIDHPTMANALILVEHCIRYVNQNINDLPECQHLASYVALADAASRRDPDIPASQGKDDIELLAEVFLMLVDTFPCYSEDDPNGPKYAQIAKKAASLTLRSDLIHGVRTADWWRRYRRDVFRDNPSLLDPPDAASG